MGRETGKRVRQRCTRLTKKAIYNWKKLKVSEMWAPVIEEVRMSEGEDVVAGGR